MEVGEPVRVIQARGARLETLTPTPRPESLNPARAPWWERNIQYLLPVPTLLLLLLYVVYPTITTIEYSLNHVAITAEGLTMRFTGLDNFVRAFRDPLIANAARITLEWVVV